MTHPNHITVAPSYSSRIHSPQTLREIVRHYIRGIKALQKALPETINCLAASGTSGIPLLGAVSYATNLPGLVIRRSPTETSRDPSMVVGSIPQEGARYLFIDDLISSGETLRRCHRAISAVTKTLSLTPARCMAAGIYYGSGGVWGRFSEFNSPFLLSDISPFPIVRMDEFTEPPAYRPSDCRIF